MSFFPTKNPFHFNIYRSLRNNRTRIHKNLFVAIVIQVLIRLTLYIDQVNMKCHLLTFPYDRFIVLFVQSNQAVLRSGGQDANESSRHGIDNTVRKFMMRIKV